jgi:HAD superfamily hydrolase (TIGR01484 family)
MVPIRLLILDFDGTLIGREEEYPLYNEFADAIRGLKRRFGTVWAVSTGRSRRSFRRYFAVLQSVGLLPDYIITEHAYIARRAKYGYVPHSLWNAKIWYRLWFRRSMIQYVIDDWHKTILRGIHGSHTLLKERGRLTMRFNTQEAADIAAEMLREKASVHRYLMVFKYLTEVDVRVVPYAKGLAVSELARHLEVEPANTLAIGDGHNDISMFRPEVAVLCGCPANAEAEVMELVQSRGGHIAARPSLGGVLDVLHAYETDSVNSALPGWWTPPENRRNPRPGKRSKHQRPPPRLHARAKWVLAGVVYLACVVFAHFGVLPGPLNDAVMKPYRWLWARIVDLLAALY